MFYTYIIQSDFDGSFYKGFSENYEKRIDFHNQGMSRYTRRKIPWKLVHVEVHKTKKEALIREKILKS